MSEGVKAIFASLAVAVALGAGICFWWSVSNPNPCQTLWSDKTGVVQSGGHTFTCFHGDIVGLQKTARMGQRGVSK